MFQFNNLQELHNDMKNKKETRVIFPFSFNNKNFSCIFLTDIYPYQYSTKSYIENYKELITYLKLNYDPNHIFKPNDFFSALNKKIPIKFTTRPTYNQVLKTKSKNIENPKELYFCGWRKSPTGRVSKENLEKTKQAFGDKYVEISKKYGISSC